MQKIHQLFQLFVEEFPSRIHFQKTMPDPEDSGVGGCSAPGEEDDELFWYIPMTDSHGTGILYT